jgi:hypothetical protein
MTEVIDKLAQDLESAGLERGFGDVRPVFHWYDFLCPFCYVGQHRTAILVRHGLDVAFL